MKRVKTGFRNIIEDKSYEFLRLFHRGHLAGQSFNFHRIANGRGARRLGKIILCLTGRASQSAHLMSDPCESVIKGKPQSREIASRRSPSSPVGLLKRRSSYSALLGAFNYSKVNSAASVGQNRNLAMERARSTSITKTSIDREKVVDS